ncbi:transposase [Streptomyces albidoflavus]
MMELLTQHGDNAADPVPVVIETPRGLLVAACGPPAARSAINPLAAARCRDRASVSRSKSDAADARVLANIPRTDRHAHRPLPDESETVQAVAVLARAHQDAIRDRQQMINRLRSHLRAYDPAALTAFHGARKPGLDSPRACVILAAAPTPADAARLTRSQLRALLKRGERPRCGIEAEVERLRTIFRAESP